jgi:hypothetical protein
MDHKRHIKFVLTAGNMGLALAVTVMLSGCQGTPRMRAGAFFGSPGGLGVVDPAHLGSHSYGFGLGEKSGMVYTSRGGFIDMGHLREAADRTAYLANIAYENLSCGKTEFSFRVVEPSRYHVRVSYPADWNEMSPESRERLARQASIPLGQYLAHRSLIWHEIITWHGFASTGLFSERISSFSFEDTYSDATGIDLAGQALQDERPYDKAMTMLIDQRLLDLGAQRPDVTHEAVKRIAGKWYTGEFYFFVRMKEPSFDVGFADARITPRLVPGLCSGSELQTCPVPQVDTVAKLGFGIEVEIDAAIWQENAIYHSIHLKHEMTPIRPEVHFPELIQYISVQTR